VAHDLVYDCCRKSLKENVPFLDSLLSVKEISSIFDKQELKKIISPTNYLGASPAMAQKFLDNRK
jgi:3-carboxy-cis,cis-muconate cycloisomerase